MSWIVSKDESFFRRSIPMQKQKELLIIDKTGILFYLGHVLRDMKSWDSKLRERSRKTSQLLREKTFVIGSIVHQDLDRQPSLEDGGSGRNILHAVKKIGKTSR